MNTNFTQSSGGCRPRPNPNPSEQFCPEQPGTILRISIPAGATIRLAFFEITSPSGICLLVRLRGSIFGGKSGLGDILGALKNAGASVEVVK